jgi:hypothetical protein
MRQGYNDQGGNGSLSWTAQRRAMDDEEGDIETGVAGRVVNTYNKSTPQLSWSSIGSSGSRSSSYRDQQQPAQRRYVKKELLLPPTPTPVWMLDFTKSTQPRHGIGAAPVFVL